MTTSQKGIDLIKKFEGLRLQAYKCPADVWTIGYGHTGKDVTEGKRITQQQAELLLKADLAEFERTISRIFPTADLPQNKFDALVSFCYNVGTKNFNNSTLRAMVKQSPVNPAIREQFMRWIYVNGKVVSGLQNRRKAEADLYFS
jgi:lysozyme